MKTLIAIPCFNEEQTIINVCKELSGLGDSDIRVFLDGPNDKSAELVANHKIPFHFEEENYGLSRTFQTIIEHFLSSDSYSRLIIVDGDGQFPISEIQKIFQASEKMSFDFYSGSRFMHAKSASKVPLIKRIGNRLVAKSLTKLLHQRFKTDRLKLQITDPSCGLRVYSRNAASQLLIDHDHSYTLQSWIVIIEEKIKFKEIPISAIYFKNRQSAISSNLFTYARYISRVLTNNWFNMKFRLFLKLFATTFLLGILFLIIFFLSSIESSQFSGNLYLGAIGGFLVVVSLNCLIFAYLLRLYESHRKLSYKLSMNTNLQRMELSNRSKTRCLQCST